MRMALTVQYLDGSAATVMTAAADLVKFEERFNRSVAKLETELRLTDLCFLAWHALRRTGQTGLEFDAWLDTLATVEPGGGDTEVIPLESTAPTG